ncbi:TetR/AcrR family transcriptional regulator [Metaclostridioides mangenotii]|uniref:TetR/AcrR family transcriptional regulator n=1 Tax=Metaclostridioides mangenotii TaxID=1540 RepID=UPI000A6C39C5|nr:TetR/AcrR family transcriptional regulator [Clostridioides mangenotii]
MLGIKESSIYYHFKSKQSIFDYIVEYYSKKEEKLYEGLELPYSVDDANISIYAK